MKRNLLIILAAVALSLIGKYAFPSTNINGDRTVTGTLGVTGHVTLEGVTSTGATGTGALVYATSPALVTPALGTPASGDASNMTNIPVTNAKSGSVLPGLNGGGLVLIATNTLGSPAANVTFNSLGTYKQLELRLQAACSSATANQGVGVQVNADSAGTNYSRQFTLVTNATTTAGQNNSTTPSGAAPLVIACASSLANTSGVAQFIIPNYSGTTFTKQGFSVGGWFQNTTVTGQAIGSIAWQWNSTAAITSIILAPADGSNFVTGSSFQVYGLN